MDLIHLHCFFLYIDNASRLLQNDSFAWSTIFVKLNGSSFIFSDEVGALVFDIGSYSVRAGYAGEDCPKVSGS